MFTKEQVKEYLDKYDFSDAEAGMYGFDTELEDLFDTEVVQEEEEYHKHSARYVYAVHKVVDTEIYFQTAYLVDYNYGAEFESWCFVEPVTKTTVVYRAVK